MPKKIDSPAQVAQRSMCAGCEGREPKRGEEDYPLCIVCASQVPEEPAA